MYRKIPKSTARGICRSRSPITMDRPGKEGEKPLAPELPTPPDPMPSGMGGAGGGHTHKQGHQQACHPLLLDLLDLGLVPRRHSLAHDGERVGVSDGADGGGSQPGQAKEGTDAAHGHDEQQVQMEARALLQHALLLGDDQPEWDMCSLRPWEQSADNQVSPERPAASLFSEPGGPSPFGPDEFRHGAEPSLSCPPTLQDSSWPELGPSQQMSAGSSAVYKINPAASLASWAPLTQ